MTNSISKCNKTKTKPWKSSITKIITSKNWNKNALPRTLAFEVWRTKNTGFWGLKNLLPTQISQLALNQAASIYPTAPWLLPNPRPIHSQIKHIVGQLLPISPPWNPKPKTKKTTKNQPNHLNLNLDLLIIKILTQLNNSSEISLVADSFPRLSTHSPTVDIGKNFSKYFPSYFPNLDPHLASLRSGCNNVYVCVCVRERVCVCKWAQICNRHQSWGI